MYYTIMHGSYLLYIMRVCKNGIKPHGNITETYYNYCTLKQVAMYLSPFEFLKGYPWNIHPCFFSVR